jgi:hypothetical protein
VIALLSSIVFLVAGVEATSLYFMLGQVMELEIEIPIWWVYLAFPCGFGIMILFALELIWLNSWRWVPLRPMIRPSLTQLKARRRLNPCTRLQYSPRSFCC